MQPSHVVSNELPGSILDVFWVTVEFLTLPPEQTDSIASSKGRFSPVPRAPCTAIQIPESFFVLSGTVQTLFEHGDRPEWVDVKAGDFIYAGGAKHAHRNVSDEVVVELITTTPMLGRFFQEIGRPRTAGGPPALPTDDDLQHLERVAAKYHHWLASAAENAAVGIEVP